MKTIFVCDECSSPKVYADAFQSLNDPGEIITYDYEHCGTCEGECSTKSILVPDSFDTGERYGMDGGELAEWVGLHYKVDFNALRDEQKRDWAERYWAITRGEG